MRRILSLTTQCLIWYHDNPAHPSHALHSYFGMQFSQSGNLTSLQNKRTSFFFVYERHHALWLPGGGISLNANYITGVRGRADVRRSRTRALSVDTEPTEGAYRFNRIHLPSLSYPAISGLCDQYSSVCSNDTKKNNINIYCEPIFQYYFYNIRSNIKHAKQCAIILHLLPFLSSLLISFSICYI